MVLRLRDRTTPGATAVIVLADYARRLEAVGGRLFLSGVDPELVEHIEGTRRIGDTATEVFEATEVLGESSDRALDAALAWLQTVTSVR